MTCIRQHHRHCTAATLRVAALVVMCLTSLSATAQVRRQTTGNATAAGTSLANSGSTANATGAANPFATGDSTFRDTNTVRGLVYHKETPDSVLQRQVFMFAYNPLTVKIDQVWHPVLSPTGIQFADRLDAFNGNYYLGKGSLGQPHYSIFPTLTTGIGERLQPDPNSGYSKRRDNIRLYQTMTPYTTLGYHSSLDKDYQVHVSHTQNVRPGWNVAFDYDLLCPEGVYTSSGVKNNYLVATTNYFSSDSRLQAAGGVIWQSFNIDENGGIYDDSYFTRQLQSNRAGVPVNLYNSGTRHHETAAFAKASYNMVQQQPRYRTRDSLCVRTVGDTLSVVDTLRLTDTIAAPHPKILNAGIICAELYYERSKRVFVDSTLWLERTSTLFWTNDAYPDYRWRNPLKMTLGILTRYARATIDGRTPTTIHSYLNPFASVDMALGRHRLGATTMTSLASGDYHISGHYTLPLTATTFVRIEAAAQSQRPDVRMCDDAVAAQNTASPSATLHNIVSQRYEVQLVAGSWLELTSRANHMDHNTWYDTALVVHEGATDLWLLQAALTARLHAGWLHVDMQQFLQHTTDAQQMPVPLWASKNSVYGQWQPFGKAMTLQVGIDMRYHTSFFAPTYDYRTGLFCHQDETEVGDYIWGDVFIDIQVKRASIYLKAGHVNALWETSPNYFVLPHYPGRKFGLYWGINWKFFD